MFIVIWQRLLIEAIFDLFYFPLWWYTRGLAHALSWCLNLLSSGNITLGPGLWLKNIFVPMFGQWDWRGRIISFFMRFFNIIIRTILLSFWLIFCLTLFLIWLLLPVVFIYSLVTSFS